MSKKPNTGMARKRGQGTVVGGGAPAAVELGQEKSTKEWSLWEVWAGSEQSLCSKPAWIMSGETLVSHAVAAAAGTCILATYRVEIS